MKFTCDSCGAQYLIADDKIGARGVKVRCKKCSHVIILRPSGFAATAGPAGSDDAPSVLTGGSASSVPVAPSVAAEQARTSEPSSQLPNEVIAATSSDLGLSQEFMALGFEDGERPAPRAATLSVGLDLDRALGSTQDPSPFANERAGGSLDLVPPEPGASERTAVEARPAQAFDQEETEMIGDDTTDRRDIPLNGGLAVPAGLGAAEPELDDEGASTRVESLQDLAREEDGAPASDESELAPPPEEEDDDVHVDEDETMLGDSPYDDQWRPPEDDEQGTGSPVADPAESPQPPTVEYPADEAALTAAGVPQPWVDDSADLGAAIAAVQRDEMAEMRSSLDGEMAGLSAEIEGFAGSEEAPKTLVGPAPGEADPSAAFDPGGFGDGGDDRLEDPAGAAAALDATSEEHEAAFEGDSGLMMPPSDDDSIAEEIGSAFDAMFGGEQGLFGESEGEGDPSLSPDAEDPLAGLESTLEGGVVNQAQTRVFNTEAMAQVEAEQERATFEADVTAPETKQWYVAIDEEQVGPLTRTEVQAHWQNGKLEADSLCWRAGMGDWAPMREVDGLADIIPPPPEPRVPTVIESGDAPAVEAPPAPADEEAVAAPEPPKIEPDPEPEPAAPRASSEPAWRPSAASALASLAAEELSAPVPAPAAALGAAPESSPAFTASSALGASDPGVLPASDALEKLLDGGPDKSAAAQFGAAEKSESYVRPLPRRADTVSSLPLRDPTADKPKSNWILPASILGGFLLLGLILGGIMLFMRGEPETRPASEVALTAKGPQGGLTQEGLVPAPDKPPAPAMRAAPTPAEVAPGEAAAAALVAAEATPPAEVAKTEAPAKVEPEKPAPKPRRSSRRSRASRRSKARSAPPPPTREVEPPPPPARPAARSGSVEADLLGAAEPARRRATVEPEKPSLPEQLDDADVLSVLRSNRKDVRRCMDAQTDSDPSLGGVMTVELIIRGTGRPSGVKVRPDKFKSAPIGTCMVAAVKKWRFPKFSGKPMPLDFPVRVRSR